MEQPVFLNPTINPPRLASPTRRTNLQSRSRSVSPIRIDPRDLDPLLRSLSPTTTLQAFQAEPGTTPADDFLGPRFDKASTSERALGISAAQACLDLRSWTRELEGWEWPGTLDLPEPARKKMRMTVTAAPAKAVQTIQEEPEEEEAQPEQVAQEEEQEYWGSIPAQQVRAYEKRASEIIIQRDKIDVEELKDFVLLAHTQTEDSGRVSRNDSLADVSPVSPGDVKRIDDVTTLITATILQALPYLSRLNRLLETWTVRLTILRAVPSYLKDLAQLNEDINQGWAALGVSRGTTDSPPTITLGFSRKVMNVTKSKIEGQVRSLGSRLDNFLDELEGRDEVVPESWIDEFESLETTYGDWVVQAERKVLRIEWRMTKGYVPPVIAAQLAEEKKKPRPVSMSHFEEDHERDEDAVAMPSSKPLSNVPSLFPTGHDDDNVSPTSPVHRSASASPSLHHSTSRSNISPVASTPIMPAITEQEPDSASKYSRHTPISTEQLRSTYISPAGIVPNNDTRKGYSAPTTPLNDIENPMGPNVESRARAFLNGEIERTSSLQKQAKTPVRSFEHASTAFARLFKNKEHGEQSVVRTVSNKSSLSKLSRSPSRSPGNGLERQGSIWNLRKKKSMSPERTPLKQAETPAPVVQDIEPVVVPSAPIETPTVPERRVMPDHEIPQVVEQVVEAPPQEEQDLSPSFPPRSESLSIHPPRSASLPRFPARSGSLPRENNRSGETSPVYGPETIEESPGKKYGPDWPIIAELEDSSPVKTKSEETFGAVEKEADVGIAEETVDDSAMSIYSQPENSEEDDSGEISPKSTPVTTLQNPTEAEKPEEVEKSKDTETPEETTKSEDIEPKANNARQTSNTFMSPVDEEEESDLSDVEFHDAEAVPLSSVNTSPERFAENRSSSAPSINPAKLKLITAESMASGERPKRHSVIKRASCTSIEIHSRSEVRSIELTPRSSRNSMSMSAPTTPLESSPLVSSGGVLSGLTSPSPLEPTAMMAFPVPPNASTNSKSKLSSSVMSAQSPPITQAGFQSSPVNSPSALGSPAPDVEENADEDDEEGAKGGPLNAAMTKRRGGDFSKLPRKSLLCSPPKKALNAPVLPEDAFDRQVSNVLETLPATRIRFKSNRAETPVQSHRLSDIRAQTPGAPPKAKHAHRNSSGSSNATTTSTNTAPGGMTLTPAETSPKKTATAVDAVKLYHLRTSEREEPIKLFVRLVGEGERVMVRVGGGWADLADYLKKYAEHHTSRAVSGGAAALEVMNADANNGGSTAGIRRVSLNAPAAASESGNGNGGGGREKRTSGVAFDPTFANILSPASRIPMSPTTPMRALARLECRDGRMVDITATPPRFGNEATAPAVPAIPENTDTATAATENPTIQTTPPSRPTTSASKSSKSDISGSTPNGKAKNPDLEDRKARWVEGMLEQARASAEKAKGRVRGSRSGTPGLDESEGSPAGDGKVKARKNRGGGYFGEMGRIGGTRRVIFRSGGGEK